MKTAPTITLTGEERQTLQVWLRLGAPARLALRANIVLLAAAGKTNQEIAGQLKIACKTVSLWRRRFARGRLAGIEKAAPRGTLRSERRDRLVRLIIRKTLKEHPLDGNSWTTRSLAKELSISPSMVQRVWKASDLNPRQG